MQDDNCQDIWRKGRHSCLACGVADKEKGISVEIKVTPVCDWQLGTVGEDVGSRKSGSQLPGSNRNAGGRDSKRGGEINSVAEHVLRCQKRSTQLKKTPRQIAKTNLFFVSAQLEIKRRPETAEMPAAASSGRAPIPKKAGDQHDPFAQEAFSDVAAFWRLDEWEVSAGAQTAEFGRQASILFAR